MPLYSFVAKSTQGQEKKGNKSAKNEIELAKELKKQGYFLISAEQKTKTKKRKHFFLNFNHVSLSDRLMATRNLEVMIGAGVSLPKALDVLALQTKNKSFRSALKSIEADILRGVALSDAFLKHPKIFPEIYSSMIKVAEKTGEMEKILDVLAVQTERSYNLRTKVKGAMIYPLVILTTMIIIGVIMMIKVVPQLSQTFTQLNVQLPATTKAVISFSNFLSHYWLLAFFLLILFFFLLKIISRTKKGKMFLHKLFLKIPLFSSLVKKINSAYAALSLSTLIKGGVPIVSALGIASDSVTNFYFKQSLLASAKRVEKGGKLSEAIACFPNLYSVIFIQMLKVGEETGETSAMLERLSNFLEDQVDNTTKNLSSIIEPILLLFIGGAVAFFAISMIQPIYSIMQGI